MFSYDLSLHLMDSNKSVFLYRQPSSPLVTHVKRKKVAEYCEFYCYQKNQQMLFLYHYLPQGKVMFLHLFVCSLGEGVGQTLLGRPPSPDT